MQTTKEVSQRLGVNVQTVRRWSDEHQQHMSAESRNADQRMYTDDDLLVLWSIRRWRQLGYGLLEIKERLGKGERATDTLPPLETNEPPKAVMVTESVYTAALVEIRRLDAERERLLIERDVTADKNEALNEKIAALTGEIGELRGKLGSIERVLAERPPASYWLRWLAVAVIVAVIIMIVLFIVVMQAAQIR